MPLYRDPPQPNLLQQAEDVMDPDFWLDRWNEGRTGWQEPGANALLQRHFVDLTEDLHRLMTAIFDDRSCIFNYICTALHSLIL